jgi:prevent-host-death family protein
MAQYSVAEAKARFSELIDKAVSGQAVVITRHGSPVVEIRLVGTKQRAAPSAGADLDAMAARRERRKLKASPVAFLLSLRDSDDL